MTRYPGWDDILEEGETILWQGRPTTRLRISFSQIVMLLFGLGLSGFAVYWMDTISKAGDSTWALGLILFFTGIAVGAGPIIIENFRRRSTWYTLTDQRAFIGTDTAILGRRLKSYPINSSTVLEYRNEDPPSIYFAVEFEHRSKSEPLRVEIGFVGIPEASDVFRMMRELQGVPTGRDKSLI